MEGELGFGGAQTSCLCNCGLSSCCSSQGRCCVRPRHGPCLTLDHPLPLPLALRPLHSWRFFWVRPHCNAQGFELSRVQPNKTVTHTCGQASLGQLISGTGLLTK